MAQQTEIKEQLAEYAHNQWTGWMRYLFSKGEFNEDGTWTMPNWAVERWKRQMNTEYKDLLEEEKDSDRKIAEGMLNILKQITMAQQTAVEWLEEQLNKWSDGRFYLPPHLFEQAKQIQKKQIENAWEDGKGSFSTRFPEQYYNETFTSTPQGENPSATRTEQS